MRFLSRVFLFALLLFFCETTNALSTKSPPNIVFILADDLGIYDLHCYGRKDHRTPHLDQLAAEGIRFTSAYCAQPICSPSRAAILTGKSPARLHLTTYLPGRADAPSQKLLHPKIQQQLPLEEKTVAEWLKEAGYATACIGKWHLGGKGFLPPDQGFDFYYPGNANTALSETEGGKGEYDLTTRAIQFIEENRSRPFFLYLTHNTPHINFTARTNLVQKNIDAFNPIYAALIETMDDAIGKLVQKLDQLSLRTNTIVIFTSDNGGLHVPEGAHKIVTHNGPFRAGKGYLYEGGLRVPLLVRWPGTISSNQVVSDAVINTDWTPTLLELVRIPSSTNFDGKSIAPILVRKQPDPGRRFCWHFPHYTNQGSRPAGAVRDGHWKLIQYYEDDAIELFNLAEDPGEKHNRAESEAALVQKLKAALQEWRTAMGAQTNESNPRFNPELHHRIYRDFDSSLFQPHRANSSELERALEWRIDMDAALRQK